MVWERREERGSACTSGVGNDLKLKTVSSPVQLLSASNTCSVMRCEISLQNQIARVFFFLNSKDLQKHLSIKKSLDQSMGLISWNLGLCPYFIFSCPDSQDQPHSILSHQHQAGSSLTALVQPRILPFQIRHRAWNQLSFFSRSPSDTVNCSSVLRSRLIIRQETNYFVISQVM